MHITPFAKRCSMLPSLIKETEYHWVPSETLEKEGAETHLRNAQGIVVPGGFGIRGIEGMVKAATYAREKKCLTSAFAWGCR